jgi:hypothetical protein
MHATMRRSPRVAGAVVIAGALAASAAGCGGSDYKNKPRPPVPIVLTASISPERVSVSPTKFGGGPVTLIVTNQTQASQQLTLESDGGSAVNQQTGPINPHDTATLKADLTEGTYSVHVAGRGIRPQQLDVGPERPSAQNELLQP